MTRERRRIAPPAASAAASDLNRTRTCSPRRWPAASPERFAIVPGRPAPAAPGAGSAAGAAESPLSIGNLSRGAGRWHPSGWTTSSTWGACNDQLCVRP